MESIGGKKRLQFSIMKTFQEVFGFHLLGKHSHRPCKEATASHVSQLPCIR